MRTLELRKNIGRAKRVMPHVPQLPDSMSGRFHTHANAVSEKCPSARHTAQLPCESPIIIMESNRDEELVITGQEAQQVGDHPPIPKSSIVISCQRADYLKVLFAL